jgi:hypothetical protein
MTTNRTSFLKTFNDKKMGQFDGKNLEMTQNGSRLQWTSFFFLFLRNILPPPLNPSITLIGHHFIMLSIRPSM